MSTDPKLLGKYELRERLGRGGMAEVWKAFDTQLERYVAIKMLHADLQADPEFINRFTREARVIASLHHPNIVQIHDFQITQLPNTSSPTAYMVMDYIEGQTLGDYIRSTSRAGKFPAPLDILRLFTSIGKGLDYAHQRGMIHRDIKPANIVLDKRNTAYNPMGEPILTDFGIAKLMGVTSSTLSGTWLGTPLYMSPEQAQGYPGNERSDIYSLGVILYEMCTGVQPFRGDSVAAIMMQHLNAMPTSPMLINPNIPPTLTMVILRCLAKDPAARFGSAAALTVALADALNLPAPADIGIPPMAASSTFSTGAMSGPILPTGTEYSQPAFPASMPFTQQGQQSPHTPAVQGLTPPGTHTPYPGTFSGVGVNAFAPGSGFSAHNPVQNPQAMAPDSTPPGSVSRGSTSRYENQTSTFSPNLASPQVSPPLQPPGKPTTIVSPTWLPQPRRRKGVLIALIVLLLIVLVGSGAGAFLLLTRNAGPAQKQIVGHAFFVSSGNVKENSTQGIADRLQIQLQHISPPPPGKMYYAWLLRDSQVDPQPILLGTLQPDSSGDANLPYLGNGENTNLLALYSRFLVTAEDAGTQPASPSLDTSTWRYYAEFSQTKNPSDPSHFSLLDHLRHLLAQDPKLKTAGLTGGLDTWLFKNTEKLLEWAGSARDAERDGDAELIYRQATRILDYLDGYQYIQTEHLRPGTTLLVDRTIAHVALLEFDPLNQFPPGYLDHITTHLREITLSPNVTPEQKVLAIQIGKAINNVQGWLDTVHTYAAQLVQMSDSQLVQPRARAILDDMFTMANAAFVGQVDPHTNQVKEGVVQIHYNSERLATFDIAACTAGNTANPCA